MRSEVIENTAGNRSRRFDLSEALAADVQRWDRDWALWEDVERGRRNLSEMELLAHDAEKMRLEVRLDALGVATKWGKRRGLRTAEIRRRVK